MPTKEKTRCKWCLGDDLYIAYHDTEWGVPVKNDRLLFEFITLEGAQAGLSWLTVLKKREHYRKVFENFHPEKVAKFNARKIESLLKDPGIIRNRLKVESTISNAKAFLAVQKDYKSFSNYLWSFVDYKQIQNSVTTLKQIPARTPLSDTISKDLKKRGFRFVGSTICYALMQAVGIVNDHTTDCFRYKEIKKLAQK